MNRPKSPVSPLSDLKLIGSGSFGSVYEIDENTCIKCGLISYSECDALWWLQRLGICPLVYRTETGNPSGLVASELIDLYEQGDEKLQSTYFIGSVVMEKISGSPLRKNAATKSRPYKAFVRALNEAHKLGISHNDLQTNHVIYDKNRDSCKIIDWGRSEVSFKRVLLERNTLGLMDKSMTEKSIWQLSDSEAKNLVEMVLS